MHSYEVQPSYFSLKKLSAVRVTYQLLVASGIVKAAAKDVESIQSIAVEKAKGLVLPQTVIQLIKSLVKPVALDAFKFHRGVFGLPLCPSFTSLGAIDIFESTKNLLVDQAVDKVLRYIVACEACHLEDIPRLVEQLNEQETNIFQRKDFTPLAKFWLNAYRNRVQDHFRCEDLSEDDYCKGFIVALECCNNVAIKYFFGRLHATKVTLVLESFAGQSFLQSDTLWSRTHMLFSSVWKIRDYPCRMLQATLRWPDQEFFLKTARECTLTKVDYWTLLSQISDTIKTNCCEFDYRYAFKKLWEMMVTTYPELPEEIHFADYLSSALESRDEGIIKFVTENIPDAKKEIFLLVFSNSKLCNKLFVTKAYKTIKIILRCFTQGVYCANGMQTQDLLSKFKYSFILKCTRCRGIWSNGNILPLEVGMVESGMRDLDEMINELIATSTTDNALKRNWH